MRVYEWAVYTATTPTAAVAAVWPKDIAATMLLAHKQLTGEVGEKRAWLLSSTPP